MILVISTEVTKAGDKNSSCWYLKLSSGFIDTEFKHAIPEVLVIRSFPMRWKSVRDTVVSERQGKQLGLGKITLEKRKKQKKNGEEWTNQQHKKSQWNG